MTFLLNQIFILTILVLNKFGRGNQLKKKSFSGQRILERNFPKQREFCFIQVGANDGKSFDCLYDFVVSRKSSGLVIEPVLDYYKELVINYKDFPDIIKINKAIHSYKKITKIYKIKESSRYKYHDWVKGIASIDKNHHRKTNILLNDMEEEEVLSDTLMNIISDSFPNKKVDYVQIDTEGYDLEILRMLDFNTIKPLIIKYEHSNLDNSDVLASRNLLTKQGYSIFTEGNDTFGIDLFRLKLV